MLYQSLAAETFRPAACSGDMYAAVPSHVHLGGLGQPLAAQLGRQAEVEEHDPAPRRHQHVRRLDVAVQLARVVNRRDPPCELEERVAEAPPAGRREGFGAWAGSGRSGAESDRSLADVGSPSSSSRSAAGRRQAVRRIAPYVAQEVGPIDQLHDDVPATAVEDELVEPHEVEVDDLQEAAKLLLEPEDRPRALVPDRLERDHGAAVSCRGLGRRRPSRRCPSRPRIS